MTCLLRKQDCFYTKEKTVLDCLSYLNKIADVHGHDLWVEPSAGGGGFLRHLPSPKIGLDISPTAPNIIKKDFLRWQPTADSRNTIVVGNPPFGKNASLAVRFFNHAATFAYRIAMIFPRTFRKNSIINRLDRHFHLDNEMVLPNNSFESNGRSYSVPTVFQVWTFYNTKRKMQHPPKTHPHFSFVTPELAEFAIQRVGANAGRVKLNVHAVSPHSHYFLRTNVSKSSRIFRTIDWSLAKYDTAGNPSLSKPDVVHLYSMGANSYAGSG